MPGRDVLAGRYELGAVLGCGGMAEVRDGWDMRLRRRVAVKLLHPMLLGRRDLRARFDDEARAAGALSHPHIVAVHDFGDDDGSPFIVMERLPGPTLHDEIAAGPLSPARTAQVLHEVLAALGVAHAAGVVHRDIKPGNILLTAEGSAKVADFGIAKTASTAHTMTGQIVGTMAYLSPERLTGAAATPADDLYALGIVGYEALTGHHAYPHENPATMAHAIASGPPPPIATVRPDIDPVLATVIGHAIARDPRLRFASAVQMQAALRGDPAALPGPSRPTTKVLEHPVLPRASSGVVSIAWRDRIRRRPLMAAAAALVGLLVAALAFATDPSSHAPATEPASVTTPVSTVPTTTPPTTTPPPPSTSALPVTQTPAGQPKSPGNGKGRGGDKKRGPKGD